MISFYDVDEEDKKKVLSMEGPKQILHIFYSIFFC